MWIDGWTRVMLYLKQHEDLVWHAHKEMGQFGVICYKHNIGGEGCNCRFNSLFFDV